MENTIKWFRAELSNADSQELRDSIFTFVFAAVIGGLIAVIFVPSVKEVMRPVLDTLLSAL